MGLYVYIHMYVCSIYMYSEIIIFQSVLKFPFLDPTLDLLNVSEL